MMPARSRRHVSLAWTSVAVVTVGHVLLSAEPGATLQNGYGFAPGMGWEGDYQDPAAPGPGRGNASYIAAIAEFIANGSIPLVGGGGGGWTTLKDLGYWYVNPSSSWDEMERSPTTGELVPRKDFYPDGIEPTVDHIHALGLGYGTYGDRGTLDCDKRPGQLGHEAQDAAYFAKIGVDWLKSDSCYDTAASATAIAHYATMRDALNATGRPIWYALCGWEPFYASDPKGGTRLANSARIGPDTGSGWSAVLKNIDNLNGIGRFAGHAMAGGFWNDGSLQLAPGVGCHGGDDESTCMSRARHRSMFSLYCVHALNLVMTGNLPGIAQLDPAVMETWSNSEAIAVNQDTSSWTSIRHGRRLDGGPPLTMPLSAASQPAVSSVIYAKAHTAECGGEPTLQLWNISATGAILNNATDAYVAMAGCDKTLIYDGCSFDPNVTTCAGRGDYRHFEFTFRGDGAILSQYNPALCVSKQDDSTLEAVPCGSPLPASQTWIHTSGQITDSVGHCLTASQPSPPGQLNTTAVFGRPLSSTYSPAAGAYSVLLLNNQPTVTNVTCGVACVANMGLPSAFPETAFVRDLWAHSPLAPIVSIRSGFSVAVHGAGASMLLKLCASEAECANPTPK